MDLNKGFKKGNPIREEARRLAQEYKWAHQETMRDMKRREIKSRVYFVLAEGVAIKIGFTSSIKNRFIKMQIDCPLKLYLIGVLKGGIKLETQLHKQFKKYRIRGEWFQINDEIINYAKENTLRLKNVCSSKIISKR